MPLYRVTVTFDRRNPKTKNLERNSVREGVFYSTSAADARQSYLRQVDSNERVVKIHKITVEAQE